MIRISLSEEGKPPRVLTFDRTAVTIGRRKSADLHLHTAGISAAHCKVSRVGNGYVLEDLGSTNGTFLNRRKIVQPSPIHPGDEIDVPGWTLRIVDEQADALGMQAPPELAEGPGGDPRMGGKTLPPARRKPGEPDEDYERWDELANAWDHGGRSNNMLLSGKTIKEAEIWYARARGRDPKPTTLHREFIAASKDLERRKVRRITAIVGLGVGTLVAGGLVTKLLLDKPDRTGMVIPPPPTSEGKPDLFRHANPAARRAIALAEEDPRTATLIAAAALSIVARDPFVAGSDPDRALRTSLGRTRGRALVDNGNAGSGEAIGAVAISPTGDKAIATTGKNAKVWDLQAGAVTPVYLRGHLSNIELAEATPDGRWLVTADTQTIRLWDLRAEDPGTDVRILREQEGKVDRLDFSANGRWMVSSSSHEGRLRIWDLHATDPSSPTGMLGEHGGSINDVAIAADGSFVAIASDMSVKVLQLDKGKPGRSRTLGGHDAAVLAIAVSPDGRWLLSASQTSPVKLWDLDKPVPARSVINLPGHQGPVTKVAISPNSKVAVTASTDNTLKVWDLGARDPSTTGVTFRGHEDAINDLRIDATSNWVVSAGKDAKVIAWNLAKRERVVESVEFTGHTRDARSIAISADGRWLISGSIDGNAYIWDYRGGPATNGNSFPARAHTGAIHDVAVSRDGKRFVTAGGDAVAVVWEFEPSGRPSPRNRLQGHQKPVNVVALAPNGRYAATGGQDHEIFIWDMLDQNPSDSAKPLEGHEGEITDLLFSSDGEWLFSAVGSHEEVRNSSQRRFRPLPFPRGVFSAGAASSASAMASRSR